MKKEFGKWLIDVAKLVAAGSLIIACAGFSNTSVVCLVVLCLLSIVMFVIGCSLQKDNRPKRFDNIKREITTERKRTSLRVTNQTHNATKNVLPTPSMCPTK